MRLALALEYPLMQQGGTEVLVRELLRAFGVECQVLLISDDPERASFSAEFSSLVTEHLRWDHKGARSMGAAHELAAQIALWRPDLVHWHLGYTYAWRSNRFWQSPIWHLGRLGLPVLCTTHSATELLDTNCDLSRPAWQKLLILLRAWPSRVLAVRRAHCEVCVSGHDQARMRRHFPPLRGKVRKLYHSLLRESDPSPLLTERERVVLSVGTLGGRKAQHILAEAFCRVAARHPDWRLELVGRAPVLEEVERIRASAARHGVERQVEVLGSLEHGAVLEKMRRSAIFALPSLQEALGLALQEALFHGCIAVGSHVGGVPELIDHERNGLLVPPGDVDALAAALDRLMSDDALRERLAGNTRSSIIGKGMTAEAMVRSYQGLYREALRHGARADGSHARA